MTPERIVEIEAYLAPGVERDLYTLRTVAVELLREVKRLREVARTEGTRTDLSEADVARLVEEKNRLVRENNQLRRGGADPIRGGLPYPGDQ